MVARMPRVTLRDDVLANYLRKRNERNAFALGSKYATAGHWLSAVMQEHLRTGKDVWEYTDTDVVKVIVVPYKQLVRVLASMEE